MEKTSDLIEQRRKKLSDLKQDNVNLFPNDFAVSHNIKEITDVAESAPDAVTEESPIFAAAGRMMAINRFGKSAFVRFKDRTGQIQAYIRKDMVGDEAYSLFKLLEVGDFIGAKGGMFRTKTGEWTLLVKELRLVCKAVRPLPEKFHGLKDPEKRYRQRYLDLIMNAEVRDIFVRRSRAVM